MKIAGIGRRNSPNCLCLQTLQEHSTREWVYRQGQGWIFAELTPDELAEFKSYKCGITIPRMRVRLPYSQALKFIRREPNSLVNWFAYCTMPQAYPLILSRFQIHQMTDDEPTRHTRYPVELGSYEVWLWTDEVKVCRELGCEVTVRGGWGWHEWGVPVEWKSPILYYERVFIYMLEDEFSREIGYVGQSIKPEHRLVEHLKDTENPDKVAWIQSRLAQGHVIKLFIAEKVPGTEAYEREWYWTEYYWNQGYNLTNHVCRGWKRPH